QVEDHPLGYASFEGTIPEGQYGAGQVTVWDSGTYDNLLAAKAQPQTVAEGIEAGWLEFALHGKKLRGRFALIRMGGKRGKDNCLLLKLKDEHARPGSAPAAPAPKPKAGTGKKSPAPRARAGRKPSASGEDLEFTHTDKVLFPDADVTKGDVL